MLLGVLTKALPAHVRQQVQLSMSESSTYAEVRERVLSFETVAHVYSAVKIQQEFGVGNGPAPMEIDIVTGKAKGKMLTRAVLKGSSGMILLEAAKAKKRVTKARAMAAPKAARTKARVMAARRARTLGARAVAKTVRRAFVITVVSQGIFRETAGKQSVMVLCVLLPRVSPIRERRRHLRSRLALRQPRLLRLRQSGE